MFDIEESLKLFGKQTILCIGDVMLDDFVYGDVTRISPGSADTGAGGPS